ncbi:MAG: putative transport system permease protein [Chthoniobacter sp.]|jgi:putative ABC transport system permease protein|nr:putative transport system permease protein [Chthoniobacter sp.]
MTLPLRYNLRNVLVRWRATVATILGIGLVVFVFLLVQSLAAGLEKASGSTGDPRNVMIVRRGSNAESGSQITRDQFNIIQYATEIARDGEGKPFVSADTLVIVNLPRSGNLGGEANMTLRGISPSGFALRPQVTLVAGRWFEPGKRELVISSRLAKRFANSQIGDVVKIGLRELSVVGHFDGRGSAFDSEAWMAADEVRSLFSRENYSSALLRATDPASAAVLSKRLEADKRLGVRVLSEVDYYKEQTKTAAPIKMLGNFLATAMSIGAIFAAMNTMYASVGARTREIGTLRVLGFRRRSVLLGFVIEGALLALIGGMVGVVGALYFNGQSVGTISFETFSETVFEFRVTPWLALKGLIFAVVVGMLGSFLPAIRAARLPVIMALKSV